MKLAAHGISGGNIKITTKGQLVAELEWEKTNIWANGYDQSH